MILKDKELRHNEIALAAYALGIVKDFSKGEMHKVHALLRKNSRRVERVARGRYNVKRSKARQ